MSLELVDMCDATAANARHIPLTCIKVGGYTTGPGIQWDTALWSLFPHSGHVRIEQDPPAAFALHSDVLDMENGAANPQHSPGWVNTRMDAGIEWSTLYGARDYLAAANAELRKAGYSHYLGHVDAWLADWNLTRAQAAALIGTQVEGFTIRGVQWASPTSNPDTVVPGSNLTLAQALVDLTVADAAWCPAPSSSTSRPPKVWALEMPAAAGAAPAFFALSSADGGHSYH